MSDQPGITSQAIIETLLQRYPGTVHREKWGESSIFYNPGGLLPHGVYFCTIKHKDGPNDRASLLDREGVYRLNIGVGKAWYVEHFGDCPKRPEAGGVIATQHDFTLLDEVMPHPVYGWMSWVAVLNPSRKTFDSLLPAMDEAYHLAKDKFTKQATV